jgi:hypothetical protein
MIHLDIAVVIHHDQMKGKIANQMKTISIFFLSNQNRRRRYSRSRSPVQSNKRDYRQRSRSPSPK